MFGLSFQVRRSLFSLTYRYLLAYTIIATHVCSRWRHAALADASLWGAHVCEFPAFTPEMLKRSGEAGIKIDWTCASESSDLRLTPPRKVVVTSLRLALAQSYRATYIGLKGHGTLITSAISITTEAPMLKSMKLVDDCAPSSRNHSLPSGTFNSHIPQLQHLVLRGISCPPNIFNNLTHLDAGDGSLGRTGRDILASMSCLPPSLEVLRIEELSLALDSRDPYNPRTTF